MQYFSSSVMSNSSFDKIVRTRSNEKSKGYKEQERSKDAKKKSNRNSNKRNWE